MRCTRQSLCLKWSVFARQAIISSSISKSNMPVDNYSENSFHDLRSVSELFVNSAVVEARGDSQYIRWHEL